MILLRSKRPIDLDGHSLRGLLKDPQTGTWDGPDFSLSACASKVKVEKNEPANAVDQHFSIRTERYRYIHCRNGEEELYDHLQDPNEWKNQANNPEYQSVIRAMRVVYEPLRILAVNLAANKQAILDKND